MEGQSRLIMLIWITIFLLVCATLFRTYEFAVPSALYVESSSTGVVVEKLGLGPENQKLSSINRIKKLFGQKQLVLSVPETRSAAKSFAPLNLVITGFIYSDSGESFLTIKHSGISEVVKEGDYLDLSEPVMVKLISPDHVVFERSGSDHSMQIQSRKPHDHIIEVRASGKVTYTISDQNNKRLIDVVAKSVRESPHKINKLLQLESNIETGKLVLPGQDPRLFTILPFELGDKLISLNNVPASELTALKVVEDLTSPSPSSITLVRENRRHIIEFIVN